MCFSNKHDELQHVDPGKITQLLEIGELEASWELVGAYIFILFLLQ